MPKRLFEVSSPISHKSIDANAVEPYLPDDDPDQVARSERLAAVQSEYQYDWNTQNAPGVPLLKDLPRRDYFSIKWILKSGAAFAKIGINEALPPLHSDDDRAERIRDYADLFVIFDEPKVADGSLWATDESFGEQRLSGANPMSIEKVTSSGSVTALVPPNVSALIGGSTVDQEIAAGRVFVVDHREALKPITKNGEVELNGKSFKKYVPKAAALFWWNRWTRQLMPVSVLIGVANPKLFAPNGDASAWLAAKVAFQAADGVIHEMSTHLGRTHLVMGGVAIAAKRQLLETHPIHRLLVPHFRFMLALNQQAEESLIAPGGDLAVSFGAPIDQVVGVAAEAYSTWDFTGHAFPHDISSRGVGESSGLPLYAYRDDAALFWAAIGEYVSEYVHLYYGNDPAVAADAELRGWSKEVGTGAPNGAGIKGFPALDTVDSLVFALTNILFICSVQHSAVNYPQEDYLAFAPNSPFATWAASGTTDMLRLLPPMGAAEGQLNMLKQLTAFRYDELGDYAGKYTRDPRANIATSRFFANMADIDAAITTHEADRWQSYEYLRPHNVLNSISL